MTCDRFSPVFLLDGWADIGYHRQKKNQKTENHLFLLTSLRNPPTPEVVTPTLDSLCAQGVELDQHVKSTSLSSFHFLPSTCSNIALQQDLHYKQEEIPFMLMSPIARIRCEIQWIKCQATLVFPSI